MPYTCTACGKHFRYKVTQRTHKCLAKQQKDSPLSNSEDGKSINIENKNVSSMPN